MDFLFSSTLDTVAPFKSSLLYCQFCHMYSTYIHRIEIALPSDTWCIQLTLNTDSRRTHTDKYSLVFRGVEGPGDVGMWGAGGGS